MKKLLLLSAVLAGGIAATQAGINFNIGIGARLPAPRVAISIPTATVYSPVASAPAQCEQPVVSYQSSSCAQPIVTAPTCEQQVVVTPQVCEPEVYVQPRPVYVERDRYVYRDAHRDGRRDRDHRRHDARYYGAPMSRHDYR